MTIQQELFLFQGQSGFKVFELLRKNSDIHPCHALHYLQMSTEMLAKAHIWKSGPPHKLSHHAFVPFLRALGSNRLAKQQFEYEGQDEQWQHLIRKSIPLAQEVEQLAPTLARDGPNPEYPWPPDMPLTAPARYEFQLWSDLQKSDGRNFLRFIALLFERASAFL
ncbi:MAG TPA: hypothetical protein VFE47_21170 [Tepidisphaeraceae bacterium]|jgi:hypothetical protein|nr:hypothetical protein [Tepidisphaeraceae bacterium]